MARDPSKTVDFAPAWLNFNNSNKKKTERSLNTVSENNVPSKSHEPLYKSLSGIKDTGSPSRSGSYWGHPSPTSRINNRHHSSNFGDCSSKKDVFHLSPGRDEKTTHSKPNFFSPASSHISTRDGGFQYMYPNNKNGCIRSKTSGDRSLDTDFPSLSDMDISDNTRGRSSKAPAMVTNMWSKPLRLKATDSTCNQNSNESAFRKSQVASSIYKNLVPKSNSYHQKQPYRRTMSVPLNLPSGETTVPSTKRDPGDSGRFQQRKLSDAHPGSSRSLRLERTGSGKAYTSAIGVVSGHKKHRKGKTEFLNTLRQEEGDSAGRVLPSANAIDKDSDITGEATRDRDCPSARCWFENENIDDARTEDRTERVFESKNRGEMEEREEKKVNPSIKSWDGSFDHLSSSLEAEHRLLREMGWQYSDDQEVEEEPLTEDEIREFFMQNKQNGLLTVPSVVRREEAFHSAISEWKFSGIRRRQNQDGSSENFNEMLLTGDDDISSSDEF